MSSSDHHPVYSDATFVALADRFDDVLAEPPGRDPLVVAALTGPSAIAMSPSELPAVELPYYEPTSADLAAVETASDEEIDDRIAATITLAAFEARHTDPPRGLPRAS